MNIGFIGCGNMASALLKGILSNDIVPPENINVYDKEKDKIRGLDNINICASVNEVCKKSDIIFLCVKPDVLLNIAPKIDVHNKAFISIAAGITQDKLKELLPEGSRLARVMPNTPLLVGKGAVGMQVPNDLTGEESAFVKDIFSRIGIVKEIDASQMDAVTGISGSGPAYVLLFIDALTKAGIENGLPSDISYELAIATFEGACAMLRLTESSPEDLIKKICSPGGTTLAAMKVFDDRKVTEIINSAVNACVSRSKELSE